MSPTRIALAVVVAVLLLSGCAPQSIADGETDLPMVLDGYPAGDGPAVWRQPDRLIVVLGGSSSCPTVPTAIERAGGVVTLTLERAEGPVCTADMLITPQYFVLEDGRPDAVVLRSGDEERRLEVVDE